MSIIDTARLVTKIENYLDANNGDNPNRFNTMSSLLGAVIGTQLPLPSEPVPNHRIYYTEAVYPKAAEYLDTINEAYVFDLEFAYECAYLTWLDRYEMVHLTKFNALGVLRRLYDLVDDDGVTKFDVTRLNGIVNSISGADHSGLNQIFFELITAIKTGEE